MQIGPAGYTIAPVRAIAVQGPLFPWQRRYRIAKQEVVNSPWLQQRAISSPEVGYRLFTMEPLKESYWFELDIAPLGTDLFGDNISLSAEVPTLDQIAGAPEVMTHWTPAKAQVSYPLAGGTVRTVRFDIGPGVTVAIPPTNQVSVDLLVWDDDIADVIAPPLLRPILEGIRFATLVSCKATAVQYANPVSKPRWTQLTYIDGTPPQGGTTQIPLVQNAGTVQILAGEAPGGADLAIGDIDAFYHTERIDLPQLIPQDLISSALPFFPIDFDTPHNSKIIPVPRAHANVVRVQSFNPAVRANVIVDQEIYC